MAERDPNAIVSEGWVGDKKTDYDGLKIPSGVDAAQVGKQFYAYQRTYANGRKAIEWFKRGSGGGEGGQGDAVLATSEETVPAIKEKWDKAESDAQDDTKPPGGLPTRTINGQVMQWTPAPRAYDIPTGETPTTAPKPATTPRIEGTPIPGGGFDNSKPIKVHRDANGQQVGPAEALTGPEREQWEREKTGGKTDKEVRDQQTSQTGEVRKPVEGRPGWTSITRATVQGGNKTEETVYVGPDGKEVRTLPEKPETPKDTPTTVIRNGKTYIQHTTPGVNGKPGEIYWTDDKGNRTTLPPEEKGTTVKLPPGAPVFDATNAETAFRSYQELFQFINPLVLSGQISREDGLAALSGPHQITGQLLDRQKEERQSAENLRRDQLTERSQDMTQTGNRLQFSQGAANTAIRQSADLIDKAQGGSSTIVPLMVLQAGMGQAMGGFRQAPPIPMGGPMPRVAERAGAGFAPPASPSTVGQPNQLGLGAMPGVMMPTGAATAPDPARAEAIRQQAAATTDATQNTIRNLTGPPQPVPASALPSGPPARDDWRTNPGYLTEPFNDDPSRGLVGMMPEQIMRSAARYGGGPTNAAELEQQLSAEGFSPEEVQAARRRAEQRAGLVGVA